MESSEIMPITRIKFVLGFAAVAFWILTSVACSRKPGDVEGENNERKKRNVQNFKQGVLPEIFNKFPLNDGAIHKSKKSEFLFPDGIYASGYAGIFIFEDDIDDQKFDEKIGQLAANTIHRISYTDSCNNYVSATEPRRLCSNDLIPLPNVNSSYNSISAYAWSDSTYFMVFDFGEGKYLRGNSQQSLLHEDWKHGFSNGVIVDPLRRSITYWLIVW